MATGSKPGGPVAARYPASKSGSPVKFDGASPFDIAYGTSAAPAPPMVKGTLCGRGYGRPVPDHRRAGGLARADAGALLLRQARHPALKGCSLTTANKGFLTSVEADAQAELPQRRLRQGDDETAGAVESGDKPLTGFVAGQRVV